MTATREIIAALVGAGMDTLDAAALVARAAVEMSASGPTKAALRTRKWRANKPSPNVTGDAPVTPAEPPSQIVTERHQASQTVTPEPAPYILSSPSLPLKEHSEEKTGSKKARAPKSLSVTLPDDWQPDRQFAKSLGWPDQRIDIEAQRFRDGAISKGRKYVGANGWAAAWRNWCTSPYQQAPAGSNGATPRPGSKDDTRERTVNALRSLDPFPYADGTGRGESAGPPIPRQLSFVKPT